MPKALPQSKRDAIQARLKEGIPLFNITKEMNVSLQTVKNYSATFTMFGTVRLPSIGKQGRKPILNREMVEVRASDASVPCFFSVTLIWLSRH